MRVYVDTYEQLFKMEAEYGWEFVNIIKYSRNTAKQAVHITTYSRWLGQVWQKEYANFPAEGDIHIEAIAVFAIDWVYGHGLIISSHR